MNTTTTSWMVDCLFQTPDAAAASARMSARLVAVVSEALPGSSAMVQLDATRSGRLRTTLVTTGLPPGDVLWVVEHAAVLHRRTERNLTNTGDVVTDLVGAQLMFGPHSPVGFVTSAAPALPTPVVPSAPALAESLLDALVDTSGVVLRTFLTAATRPAQHQFMKDVAATNKHWSNAEVAAHVGVPLSVRTIILSDGPLTPRLRSLLRRGGATLDLVEVGTVTDPAGAAAWQGEEAPLKCASTARALVFLPAAGDAPLRGLRSRPVPAPLRQLSAPVAAGPTIRIGQAERSDGRATSVGVGLSDLSRHCHVLGQTGTGKSTLLAALVDQIGRAGAGCTVLDPHGTTVDRIVAEAPPDVARRIVLIRCGDLDFPIPLNPWANTSHWQLEQDVAALTELMEEIFDPHHHGMLGPRFERWFATVAMVAAALHGPRASLHSMTLVGRDQATMRRAAESLAQLGHRDLAARVTSEFVGMADSNATDFYGWANAKFQRLLATPHLRAILGAGANGYNFEQWLPDNNIILVDLAMPTVGRRQAQLIGTLVLQKLWAALLRRQDRANIHPVLVDEAALFEHGALPAMLAEGRKFGAAAVLAHQHLGQLSDTLSDALEANASSLVAFRAALDDSPRLSVRLGGWPVTELTRLSKMQAAATLTINGSATEPFTLTVDHNARQARRIQSPSTDSIEKARKQLAGHYAHLHPMTAHEALAVDDCMSRHHDRNREEAS